MLIKVTREHIEKAAPLVKDAYLNPKTPFASQVCPIARALKETFKVSYVSVDGITIHVGLFPTDNLIFNKPCTAEVANWIANYDIAAVDDLPLPEPFEFELDLSEVKL